MHDSWDEDEALPPWDWKPEEDQLRRMREEPVVDLDLHLGDRADEARGLKWLATRRASRAASATPNPLPSPVPVDLHEVQGVPDVVQGEQWFIDPGPFRVTLDSRVRKRGDLVLAPNTLHAFQLHAVKRSYVVSVRGGVIGAKQGDPWKVVETFECASEPGNERLEPKRSVPPKR